MQAPPPGALRPIDYSPLYAAYDAQLDADARAHELSVDPAEAFLSMPGIKGFLAQDPAGHGGAAPEPGSAPPAQEMDGFRRMERCRIALDALDAQGWKRSFFQRKFHNAFMAACARAFFKLDRPGAFQRAFQRLLEINSWNNLSQEILISTPRRFGKTISVSMFAAALLYSCAGIELSIYSTCKRISQKLLRNVVKFLDLIYAGIPGSERMRVIRANCEVPPPSPLHQAWIEMRMRSPHNRLIVPRGAGDTHPGPRGQRRRAGRQLVPVQGSHPQHTRRACPAGVYYWRA